MQVGVCRLTACRGRWSSSLPCEPTPPHQAECGSRAVSVQVLRQERDTISLFNSERRCRIRPSALAKYTGKDSRSAADGGGYTHVWRRPTRHVVTNTQAAVGRGCSRGMTRAASLDALVHGSTRSHARCCPNADCGQDRFVAALGVARI
jgi:hypothetical protein